LSILHYTTLPLLLLLSTVGNYVVDLKAKTVATSYNEI